MKFNHTSSDINFIFERMIFSQEVGGKMWHGALVGQPTRTDQNKLVKTKV